MSSCINKRNKTESLHKAFVCGKIGKIVSPSADLSDLLTKGGTVHEKIKIRDCGF